MNVTEIPTILIIVGITGDLSKRKLLPAIGQVAKAQALPDKFRVVGISRRRLDVDEAIKDVGGDAQAFLAKHLDMYQMDLADSASYQQLKGYLDGIEKEFGATAQRLFYLSVPPQASGSIVELLGKAGMGAMPNTKLLFEKPFGTDLGSAHNLIEQTRRYFTEDQIYRIDHYLAKEMAQNLIVFRQSNSLFKRAWNRDFIDGIEIVGSERIGIEGRAAFYEQTGALRDFVQSHLLQLAALTLMEAPGSGSHNKVPLSRLRALQHLRTPTDKPVTDYARRGQYIGYRSEVGDSKSTTETYVDLTLQSTDPAWEGVPIRLVTGKALKEKVTEIRITYKKEDGYESDQLIIQLQPDEGVELYLWTKIPGYEWRVERHKLALAFKDHFGALPDAYEQVILDAINADHTLFTSSEEILETWRILEPVQCAWEESDSDLLLYQPGSDTEL